MRRVALAACIAIAGWLCWGSASPHVSVAASSNNSYFWANAFGPNVDACISGGDASQCPTGTHDAYVQVDGLTSVGKPSYVDFFCDTITVSGGMLHEDWTELFGPYDKGGVVGTLSSSQATGVVIRSGPTASHGSAGLLVISAAGSWSALDAQGKPYSFSGTASAAGVYTTGPKPAPRFPGSSGAITSGRVHVSITGTLFHWERPTTSTSYSDWVSEPTTTGTMSCDVTPSATNSDGYAFTRNS